MTARPFLRTRDNRVPDVLTAAVIAALALVVVWNAFHYPSVSGYDAELDIEYARTLVTDWRIPTELANYYTPPGYFILAGPLLELGDLVRVSDAGDLAQLFSGALTVGTAMLLAILSESLFTGRAWLRFAAVAFFAACPAVVKTAAMVHPQPLVMFLSTLALVLTARLLADRRYAVSAAVALGIVLGAAQLVRSVGIWALVVVGIVLSIAALVRRDERRQALKTLGIVVGVGIVVALPWYAYLQVEYSSPILGRKTPAAGAPLPHLVPGRSAAPAPSFRLFLADSAPPHRRLWFYVDPGLPAVVKAPYRGRLAPAFWPILYSETWGDYFGFWKWGSVEEPRTPSVERRLSAQSVVGALPTFLAAAGLLALSALALLKVRLRPELMLVPLMVLIALAGCAYYAYRYPAADGDTVKALFLLPAMPSVALCFGFATTVLAGRSRRSAVLVCAPLVIGAAVSFGFVVLS
jgi:hypothetical protein